MPKHYLVRRNLETFLGPFEIEELKRAYQKMEFGLQDEVAGTFGDWISFDDLAKMETVYPELIPVIKDTMLGGWGFSQNTATRIIDKPGVKAPPPKKSSSFAWILALVLLVAAASAYYVAKHSPLGHKIFNISKSSPAIQFEKLLRSGDRASFLNHFQSRLPSILNYTRKSNNHLQEWLPSLRAYAFLTDGQIPGIPTKTLRGEDTDKAPESCTLEFWKKEWEKAKPEMKSFATQFPSHQRLAMWQRVLSWDPYWIARRSADEDWIYPRNLYHGCLIMAAKALGQIESASGDEFAKVQSFYQARFQQLIAISESGQAYAFDIKKMEPLSENSETSPNYLQMLACLDEASDNAASESCFKVDEIPSTWQKYASFRSQITRARLLINTHTQQIEKENLRNISKESSVFAQADSITGIRYDAESRYVRNLLRNNGDVVQSINDLKYHHQNVNVLIGH